MASIIPLNVYFYWHTKDMPTKMKENINQIKQQNPEFTYYLYNEETALEFLKKHTSNIIVKTFLKLKPQSYKSDLFRQCILYKYGGIYIDTKLEFNNIKLIELTKDEHYVKDRIDNYIYTGFIVSKPNTAFLLDCINQLIYNVNHNLYWKDSLTPTGPGLFGYILKKFNYKLNIDIEHPQVGGHLVYNGKVLCKPYKEYYNEDRDFETSYGNLWNKRDIYIFK